MMKDDNFCLKCLWCGYEVRMNEMLMTYLEIFKVLFWLQRHDLTI